MSEHIARRALDTASQLGAGYADVRIVRRRSQNVSVKSGRVEGVSLGETEGFGVRVLVDGACSNFAGLNESDSASSKLSLLVVVFDLCGNRAELFSLLSGHLSAESSKLSSASLQGGDVHDVFSL